ncbi:MAG: L-2-amino-thiazoline-4-carboxylic acid hydrolase [Trichlorobacter sp.]|uniref:L-2-amino-thiazoline-4-carboxylic acid hydrolase n=1 Tax=Trichlorobacter sp. TaxID=2911007 RepID=UPI0025627EA8|nr:L-2-amino-thiazoline-4-carboxylic acid hydrolase [Trichlorobacter sp.]MDK9718752.1 L-2-amino-thiazoline-4-carboxylic acid hydrolase [Trichlorobacter sp.]
MQLTRRELLMLGVVTAVSATPCGWVMAAVKTNYYLKNKNELLNAFNGTLEGVRAFIEPEFGKERTQQLIRSALRRFETLLPTLPDVGGDRNWDTQYLPIAAWYVALYEPMKTYGKTAEDVGKLMYELRKYELEHTPPDILTKQGNKLFEPGSIKEMREWAAWTQKKEYPANWIATFVEGDSTHFDFGYNYSECALVKFFNAQGASELAPYVCLNDFTQSKAQGTGLERSKTIAQGDGLCNFRYKFGRPVTQNWQSEITYIRNQMAGKAEK